MPATVHTNLIKAIAHGGNEHNRTACSVQFCAVFAQRRGSSPYPFSHDRISSVPAKIGLVQSP